MRTLIMAAIAALSFGSSASAHHLWVEADGQLHFAPDLYDFDRVQLSALDHRAPLPAAPG